MSIEAELKALILSRYNSVLEFTKKIDMPYATIQSIFKRGVQNSSVTNIITICKALGISADELAEGKIVPFQLTVNDSKLKSIEYLILYAKQNITECRNYSIKGISVNEYEAKMLLEALDFAVRLILIMRNKT